jgi:hypothetical protein
MAHPQPDPASLARRLGVLADAVLSAADNPALAEAQTIQLEGVWTALANLADEMAEAATACDVPECPGHHSRLRVRSCGDPNPGSPYNAPCNRPAGHEGNHSNAFSEWTTPPAGIADDGRYLVVGMDGTRLTVSGIDSARIVAASFAGTVTPL